MSKPFLSVCLTCALAFVAAGEAASQSCKTTRLYANDFETGSGLDGWGTGFLFGNQSEVNDWRGIQTCTGDNNVFRFGDESCAGGYTDNQVSYAESPALQVPAGSTTTRLSVRHGFDFEDGKDGGRLAVKIGNSSIFMLVPNSAIVSGATHDGTLAGSCGSAIHYPGLPVFTGTASELQETVVDLDAVCGSSCAGSTIRVGFLSFTDCSFGGDGWSLDDVDVTVCAPPQPSDYYTVTPCRLVDTRDEGFPLQPGDERIFDLTGSCGIPATARAVVANVTVTETASTGHVRLWPADEVGTDTGLVHFTAGRTRANNAILTLPTDGSGEIKVLADTAGPAHFVIDVAGYFDEETAN